MDTDIDHKIVTETDPAERQALIADTAEAKRNRMKQVCSHCHTPDYVNGFYKQYDDLVILYNEKFGKPGTEIMARSATRISSRRRSSTTRSSGPGSTSGTTRAGGLGTARR